MERVQYSLESALPELKDLQENGIFSPEEIREIIKRRTHYETQLIRRQPRKKDFLEYVEYEMALERLRKKRVQRLNRDTPPAFNLEPFAGSETVLYSGACNEKIQRGSTTLGAVHRNCKT